MKRFTIQKDSSGVLAVKDSQKEFCPHTQLFSSEVRSEIFANDLVEALNGINAQLANTHALLKAMQAVMKPEIIGEENFQKFLSAERAFKQQLLSQSQASQMEEAAARAAFKAERDRAKREAMRQAQNLPNPPPPTS